jgi:hypothetical protein
MKYAAHNVHSQDEHWITSQLCQLELRNGSRLAPSSSTRPCDLPAPKTRDTSDRLLPPERLACTRTSLVPSSSRHFRSADTPQRIRLCVVVTGETDVFTTSEPLRRIHFAHGDCFLQQLPRHPWTSRSSRKSSAGIFFPRCTSDRASDVSVALDLASPVVRLRGLAVWAPFRSHTWVGGVTDLPRPPLQRFVKSDAGGDPRRLRSGGTLRRIRWSLRPRFRDRPTTFWVMKRPLDDALTPPWAFAGARPFLIR